MKKSRLRRIGTVLAKLSEGQVVWLRCHGLIFGRKKNGKVRVDAAVAKLLRR